jgi:hypothetical protein
MSFTETLANADIKWLAGVFLWKNGLTAVEEAS